jgi:hypothetical protein
MFSLNITSRIYYSDSTCASLSYYTAYPNKACYTVDDPTPDDPTESTFYNYPSRTDYNTPNCTGQGISGFTYIGCLGYGGISQQNVLISSSSASFANIQINYKVILTSLLLLGWTFF